MPAQLQLQTLRNTPRLNQVINIAIFHGFRAPAPMTLRQPIWDSCISSAVAPPALKLYILNLDAL